MDIPRPSTKKRGRWIIGVAIALLLVVTSVALSRLEPAAPTVEAAGVWRDTVERGTMVRQVRGPGTLVPEQIRYISAVTAGRVERVLVQPGITVTPETPLVVLSNPDVQLQAMEAQRLLAGAEADRATLRAQLENNRLTQEAAVATVRAQHREAMRELTKNREMA